MKLEVKTDSVLTIDDGRHGQDNAVAVVDDGVHRLVFNNVKVVPQVAVCLYEPREQQQQLSKAQETTFSSDQHPAD